MNPTESADHPVYRQTVGETVGQTVAETVRGEPMSRETVAGSSGTVSWWMPWHPWQLWRTPAFWGASAHLVLDFPIALTGFIVVVVLISVGGGLVPAFGIGIPVLVAGLWLARAMGDLERLRFAATVGVVMRAPDRTGRGLKALLTSGDAWRSVLYWLISMPLSAVSFGLVIGAWSAGLALMALPVLALTGADVGVSFWGLSLNNVTWSLVIAALSAVVGALLIPFVVRLLIGLDVALARAFLTPGRRRELAARVEQLTESRSRVVDAAEEERRRMERDLHDGAQQRLVAMSMTVGRLSSRLRKSGDGEGQALAEQAQQEIKAAIGELRDLTRGLHPPVLTDRGLDAALSAVAARCPIPVGVSVELPVRPPLTLESIIYFFVSEALTNVAKHAQAHHAWVVIEQDGATLRASVADDGIGGVDTGRGTGVAGLADRAAGVDGILRVTSPVGGPTVVEMELPCAS